MAKSEQIVCVRRIIFATHVAMAEVFPETKGFESAK